MLEALDVGIEHPVVTPTIDVPIAIQTSVKAVLVNPFTMALWGLIVAGSLAVGFLGVCRSRGRGARSRAFDLACQRLVEPASRGVAGHW